MASTAMPKLWSLPIPPRKVCHSRTPLLSSLAAKPSFVPPPKELTGVPQVVVLAPATDALPPAASTAVALPLSLQRPPMNVRHSPTDLLSSLAAKPSFVPPPKALTGVPQVVG